MVGFVHVSESTYMSRMAGVASYGSAAWQLVNSKFSFLTEDTKNSKYIYFEINNDIFEILVKNTCKSIPRKSRLLTSCIEKSKWLFNTNDNDR